ncbi:hypothetical protein Tco_1563646 [Tanacetum coccineum]
MRGLCPYLYTNGVLEAKGCLCLILGHVEQLEDDEERLEDELSRLESSMEVVIDDTVGTPGATDDVFEATTEISDK